MTRTTEDLTTVRPLIDFLIDQRKTAGISRYALAARIGCRRAQLDDWENGVHAPGTTWLARWGQGLGHHLGFFPNEVQQ